ncbi:uncharacterized protein [Primulina eburnea]|uniref:uncharacterized protein n=1 Tax=Primulina eburnea TaxID=1245227 RepID=UPI003C6C504C
MKGGTSESFGNDPIDDNDIGLDDVSIGDDEDSLDGSIHESDEDVDSNSSTENDAGDDKRRSQPKPHNEKATECWYNDIELEDELISLASSDDDDSCPKHHVFSERMNMKRFELVVGMKFKDVHEFRSVLVDWTVRSGVELVFKKNEKRRVTAVCKDGCEWRLHTSLVMGGPTFRIKTLTGKHTCVRASSNKLATYKYLSKRIEMIVCENPTIPVDKLKRLIRRKCNVDVSKYKTYRAKKAALEKLKGNFKDQYLKLWDYCEIVRKYNPGSKILVKRDHSFFVPKFQRMYFSLQALKSGFLAGCRPVIGLDGCFLKTNYGGQLLVAIGRDGNENVFPISMAVMQVENFDNWRWFISELLEGIGFERWTFISDGQKGLLEALNELAPECEHRFCVRHLYQNFARKHPGLELKRMLWAAASTTNKNEFAMWMKRIEAANRKTSPDHETTAEWLNKIPPAHWARSHFLISSFSDVIVNNKQE